MNPIQLICTVAILAHLSCVSDQAGQSTSWPEEDAVSVSWKLLNDATESTTKRTCIFTIRNNGTIPMSPGWTLFFNQFPTSFELPESAQDHYNIQLVNGDLYRLITLDSFPEIEPGQVQELTYQWPVRLFKRSHAPNGVFFVDSDNIVHSVESFELEPTPAGITFETSHGAEPIQITPQKRYRQKV